MTPQEAHNDYLELLSSGGLIGFAIGVWFAVVVIREARRNFVSDGSYLRLGAILGIVGVAAHSSVDFGLHILINAIVFLCLIMIATSTGRQTNDCRGGHGVPPLQQCDVI
jgi:O-antigen ligase